MLLCPDCQPLLLDHLYGLLDPAAASAVEAHLASCPACTAAREQTARMKGLFAAAARAQFPEVMFTPPSSVTEPSHKEHVMSATPPRAKAQGLGSRIVGWSVAIAVLIAVTVFTIPAAYDAVCYRIYRPPVDEKLAAVQQAAEQRDRVAAETAATRASAEQRLKLAQEKHEQVKKEWIAAETAALARAASTPFHVQVHGPSTAVPGAPNQYHIQVTDEQGRPHTAQIDISIKTADGKELYATRFAPDKAPDSGRFILPPGVWSQVKADSEVFLNVSALDAKTGARNDLTENIRLLEPTYTTFLTTDKPMYRPGETVYYRSLTLDRSRFLPPATDVAYRFEIKGPAGQVLPGSELMGMAKPSTLDRFGKVQPIIGPDGQPVRGVGSGSYTLNGDLPGGEYTLSIFEMPDNQRPPKTRALAVRKFTVNNYTPDRLLKKLEFDAKSYGPGAVVQAKFEAKDQTTPLADADIRVTVTVDGEVITPTVNPTKTGSDGTAAIRFTLPKKDEIHDARVDVAITARGITETITSKPELATKKLNIEFFPEGGDLVAGVANRVYFRVTNTFGKPAEVVGTLTDGTRELAAIRTLNDADRPGVNQGLGAFDFTPEADKTYMVKLSSPLGVVQPVIDLPAAGRAALAGAATNVQRGYLLPAAKATGVVLNVPTGVAKAADPITVNVTATDKKRTILVGAYTRGRPIAHQTAAVEPGKPANITLTPTDTRFGGVTRITVFDAGNEAEIGRADLKPLAERLVYRQPGELLKLNVTSKKASGEASQNFTPGSKVQLDVLAQDEHGKPAPAILWATVINQSVLSMENEKTARLLPTHFLLSGEVQKGEDLEHADFLLTDHPTAAVTLDLLLGTQGWRRFAEQAPGQFRNKVPAEDADRLMVASAIEGPIPSGWRNQVRKVFDQNWPKYEAADLELEASERAFALLKNSGSLETSLARAKAEHDARLREFAATATNLEPIDQSSQARARRLPILLVCLLGASVLGFVVRGIAFSRGRAERRHLALGGIAFVLVSASLVASVVMTYGNGPDKEPWRQVYATAPRVERGFEYAVAKTNENAVADAPDGAAALQGAAVAMNPPMEADKLREAEQQMLAKDLAFPGPPQMPRPEVAAMGAPRVAMPAAAPVPAEKGMGMGMGQGMPPRGAAMKADGKDALAMQDPGRRMAPPAPGIPMPLVHPGNRMPAIPPKPGLRKMQEQRGLDRGIALNPRDRRYGEFLELRQVEVQKLLSKDKSAKGHEMLATLHTNVPPESPSLIVREYAHAPAATATSDAARGDFTETLLWQPVIVTPADGRKTLNFTLSDSIISYQIMVAGHTLDGRLGASTSSIVVRKPFSLDPKLPEEISSSDKLDVAIMGANATDSAVLANFTVKPNGLTVAGGQDQFTLDLAPNGGNRKIVRLVPERNTGTLTVNVNGLAGAFGDSANRTLTVVQDGFPINGQKSEVLEQQLTAEVKLPEQIIPGSLKLQVTMYPNTLSEVQSGLEGLLREPNGCFEQTSSNNYPNVMILNYLNETGKAAPDISGRAKKLIDNGYNKLISFECRDPAKPEKKGYEWFGGTAPPHEALTAYGLLQFTDMSRVAQVDEQMLKRTKAYLLSRRNGKGGFERNSRAVDSFGNAPEDITNAYIVWALTEAERTAAEKSDLSKEMAALTALAAGQRAKDPYFLALVANSLINRDNKAAAITILKTIADLQSKDGSVSGAETSITRSSGKDLLVETTALAVLGWLKVNETGAFRANIDPAARWMGQQRGGYGAFGGTQSTILTLKALIDYARSQKRPSENGTVRVIVGGAEIAKKVFTTEQAGPIVLDIPNADDIFKGGKADIRVETGAKQAYPCTVAWECRTRKPNSSAECPVELTTKLANTKLAQGDAVRLAINVKNLKASEHGMVVAIVGIPAGLKLPEDMKQLKKLTEKPENGREKVSYWEIRGRELILYWRGMGPNDNFDLGVDLIADHAGEFRGPASRAYLYYGSEHKHWVDPVDVSVTIK